MEAFYLLTTAYTTHNCVGEWTVSGSSIVVEADENNTASLCRVLYPLDHGGAPYLMITDVYSVAAGDHIDFGIVFNMADKDNGEVFLLR